MRRYQSVAQAVLEHAKETPDKLCLCENKYAMTYAQEAAAIVTFAEKLAGEGVKRGDCVVIRNAQNIRTVTAILGVQLLGAIAVPVEKNIQADRIREICERTEAVAVIAVKDPETSVRFIDMKEVPGSEVEAAQWDGELPTEDMTAEILFTTGTTGKSKGIVLTHLACVAVCENVVDGVEMEKDNVELIPVPISHSHGLRRTYSNLFNGSTVVLADGVVFVQQLFKLIETYGVNAIDFVPAALSTVIRFGKDKLGDYKEQIRYVQLGSAPIPEADREKLRQLLPASRLYNFYGTTESGCACILDFNRFPDLKGCIGKPVVNAEFAFFNEDGSRAEGTKENPGVLGCRGAMNMTGYLGEEKLNAEVFNDGFIVSQDLSFMDEEGRIFLIGRQGEVIVSGGAKIAPSEVEDAAGKMEGMLECACIPVPDPILGQVPKMFYAVEKKFATEEEKTAFEKALFVFLSATLEDYKVPRLYENIPAIPRTSNGKILRRALMN